MEITYMFVQTSTTQIGKYQICVCDFQGLSPGRWDCPRSCEQIESRGPVWSSRSKNKTNESFMSRLIG